MKSDALNDWQKILHGVREIRLANGLTGLVLPCTGIGSVVCDIYYSGGSSRDPHGKLGLAHFLEHMVYNGTRNVPRGILDRIILRLAGQHNAETGPDFTHFWCQLPKHALALALELEADRMTGALLDQSDVNRERPIILEEEARYREQPFEELMTLMMADLFQGHPYAHPTIGRPADLHKISSEDLRNHYQKTFRPDNAVVVIAGDTNADRASELIHQYFDPIHKNSDTSFLDQIKPPNIDRFDGRCMKLPSTEIVPRGAMLWPAPCPFDLDSRAWGVAAAILGSGRGSRLWQALVEESQTAAFVSVSLSEERYGGYLMIDLELSPKSSPEKAELLVHEVLEKLATEGPTNEEVARSARNRSSAARWARQQSATLAGALGTWSLFADWQLLAEAWRLDDFVTAQDVQKVAIQLRRDNLARGWTTPSKSKSSKSTSPNMGKPQRVLPAHELAIMPDNSLAPKLTKMVDKANRIDVRYRPRSKPLINHLPQGMSLIAESLKEQGICAIELRWRTGWLEEALPGLATITSRVCEESTDPITKRPFCEYLEDLGASIDSSSSSFTIQGRSEDFTEILGLMKRMIWSPEWSKSTVKRVAQRTRTELEADLDDPAFQAELSLRKMVYGGGPASNDIRGTLESLKNMTLTAVKDHHRQFYHPRNTILGVAGSFRTRRLIDQLGKTFLDKLDFPATTKRFEHDSIALNQTPLPAGQIQQMKSPGTQTHIVMGHQTVSRTDPDWVAMQVLEVIIGAGPGLTDLLSQRLRDDLGLVYSVSMSTTEGAWRTPGYMRISFSCDPADAKRAEHETLSVMQQVASGNMADQQCLEARDYLIRSWYISFEAADDRLSNWLDTELDDWDLQLPPTWVRTCAALTPDTIRNVARRRILPHHFQIVQFGP